MKLLRIREVMEITCLSRMTIYRMEKAGDFPSRRRLGTNSVAWVESDVNTWIETRPLISRTSCRELPELTSAPAKRGAVALESPNLPTTPKSIRARDQAFERDRQHDVSSR
jgi:prophage regulatory protein